MSNEIQCYDEEGRPKCHYYSIVRYGRLCNFDGTWNPCKTDCPHFTLPHFVPVGERISRDDFVDALEYAIKSVRSCHKCIWRNYGGNNMTCDNPVARKKMRDDPTFCTPCEFFELDETGDECYLRQQEGYDFLIEERELQKVSL